MSVTFVCSDLFTIDADALVSPVNTIGVCGKGVALAVKKKFPEACTCYFQACREGLLEAGGVVVADRLRFAVAALGPPRFVFHVATKSRWQNPSRLEWVALGLANLKLEIEARSDTIGSVALPFLGCGCGGLKIEDVKPLILATFESAKYKVTVCDHPWPVKTR